MTDAAALADELHAFCAAVPHDYPGHNIELFERVESFLRTLIPVAVSRVSEDDISTLEALALIEEFGSFHAALNRALAVLRTPVAVSRVEGAENIVDEAACLIWAELCPGIIMGDEDRPHYENAAKAVLSLPAVAVSREEVADEPKRIEVDIGAAFDALQESPELCAMMNEMVGGPALVEAQAEIERLNAVIAQRHDRAAGAVK